MTKLEVFILKYMYSFVGTEKLHCSRDDFFTAV